MYDPNSIYLAPTPDLEYLEKRLIDSNTITNSEIMLSQPISKYYKPYVDLALNYIEKNITKVPKGENESLDNMFPDMATYNSKKEIESFYFGYNVLDCRNLVKISINSDYPNNIKVELKDSVSPNNKPDSLIYLSDCDIMAMVLRKENQYDAIGITAAYNNLIKRRTIFQYSLRYCIDLAFSYDCKVIKDFKDELKRLEQKQAKDKK